VFIFALLTALVRGFVGLSQSEPCSSSGDTKLYREEWCEAFLCFVWADQTQIMQQVKQNLDDRFHALAMEYKCCEAVLFIAVKDVCCIRAVMFCDLMVVLEFVHFVKQALHV